MAMAATRMSVRREPTVEPFRLVQVATPSGDGGLRQRSLCRPHERVAQGFVGYFSVESAPKRQKTPPSGRGLPGPYAEWSDQASASASGSTSAAASASSA